MKSLSYLAKKYKTDKLGVHNYIPIYESFLKVFKNKKIKLLEIGIGGYDHKNKGGSSIKMWSDYFSNGKIFGIDIYNKKFLNSKRIKTFCGSQVDIFFLKKILKNTGKLDFIIDDGSHINNHVIKTFIHLFPFLKEGGYYFIEDIQTSYMLEFGGDGFYLKNKNTSINFFKEIIDKINHQEIENPFYKKNYFDSNITEIHFYHNLVVVKKKSNLEKSNIIINNSRIIESKKYKIKSLFQYVKYLLFYIRSRIYSFLDLLKI